MKLDALAQQKSGRLLGPCYCDFVYKTRCHATRQLPDNSVYTKSQCEVERHLSITLSGTICQ